MANITGNYSDNNGNLVFTAENLKDPVYHNSDVALILIYSFLYSVCFEKVNIKFK